MLEDRKNDVDMYEVLFAYYFQLLFVRNLHLDALVIERVIKTMVSVCIFCEVHDSA